MDGAYLIWDELLRKIAFHQRLFLRTLVEHMTVIIVQPSRLNVRLDTIREAACQWLIHIFTASAWVAWTKRHDLDELRTLVVEACIMNPNLWTHRVIRPLIDNADDVLKSLWAPLYNDSLPRSEPGSRRNSAAPSNAAGSAAAEEEKHATDARQPSR